VRAGRTNLFNPNSDLVRLFTGASQKPSTLFQLPATSLVVRSGAKPSISGFLASFIYRLGQVNKRYTCSAQFVSPSPSIIILLHFAQLSTSLNTQPTTE
jgi:hypothetical protein